MREGRGKKASLLLLLHVLAASATAMAMVWVQVSFNSAHHEELHKALHCARLGPARPWVSFAVAQFPPSRGKWLAAEHRRAMRENLSSYDLFIYTENDMVCVHLCDD